MIVTRPTKLKQGDKIGIIAPAGPVLQTELHDGIQLLESFGHEVVLSSHLFDRQGYLAGEDSARLEDIHIMCTDNSVKAVPGAVMGPCESWIGSITIFLGKIRRFLSVTVTSPPSCWPYTKRRVW